MIFDFRYTIEPICYRHQTCGGENLECRPDRQQVAVELLRLNTHHQAEQQHEGE